MLMISSCLIISMLKKGFPDSTCKIICREIVYRVNDGVPADGLLPLSAEPRLNIKTVFLRYGIPMLKVRLSWDRLTFNMVIPTLVRHLHIQTVPWEHHGYNACQVKVWYMKMSTEAYLETNVTTIYHLSFDLHPRANNYCHIFLKL